MVIRVGHSCRLIFECFINGRPNDLADRLRELKPTKFKERDIVTMGLHPRYALNIGIQITTRRTNRIK